MMNEMDKNDLRRKFLQSVESQLTQFYTHQKEYGKQDESAKRHVEGFMYAGVVLELTMNAELKEVMERIYYDVFGMTPLERKLMKEKGEEEEMDWSYYDTPPKQR
tara:strand:- start:1663 stop:1977 length:315 start_codon:yes stop_codon:yes gene_type:complete